MSGLWYEVVGIADASDEVKNIEGNDVYIRGGLDDLLVIQVPKGVNHQAILQGIERMLKAEGIEKGVFVIDKDIQMMKLATVPRHKAKVFEAKYQEVKASKTQNAPTTETPQ